MAKGGSKIGGGGDLLGKEGNPGTVTDVKDMIAQRGKYQEVVDDVLTVSQRMNKLYSDGDINQFQTAKMSGSAMAYYDSNGNIAMNQRYLNSAKLDAAYDAAVKSKFHPGRGNKTGAEAVASHEYGHALADKVGKKIGINDIEAASREIVERARAKTNHKTNMNFAGKISGYAQYNFAETVAEAVSDWYCNGSKAAKESRAVMSVVNSIMRKGK